MRTPTNIPGNEGQPLRAGRIIDVDSRAYTASVKLSDFSGDVIEGVPWRVGAHSSLGGSGEIFLPEIGSYCCVNLRYSQGHSSPIIESFQPEQAIDRLYPIWPSLETTEGGMSSKANPIFVPYTSNRMRDALPGDVGYSGAEGQLMGLFRGGLAILKASELAQIVAMQQDDLLRVIGRNYERLSDAGALHRSNYEGHLYASETTALLESESRSGVYRLRVAAGKAAGYTNSSEAATPRSEAMYAIRLNKVEGGKEVPVADLVFGQAGQVQLRSANEIKSEVVKISNGAIPRAVFFNRSATTGDLSKVAKDHSKLITRIDNAGTLVKDLEVPASALVYTDTNGANVYAGTTVELEAEVIQEFSLDHRLTMKKLRSCTTSTVPPGLQPDPTDIVVEDSGEIELANLQDSKTQQFKCMGKWKVTHRYVANSDSTSQHAGQSTKDQDLYAFEGAEVLSVIHQTNTGEIHMQDNSKSSIDMQKGHISLKCDQTFHINCSEFKISSKTQNWANTDTVNWAQGKSTIFQGKEIVEDFKQHATRAPVITHN